MTEESRVPLAPRPVKTVLERIVHAWEPLKNSFSVQLFSVVTIAEVLGLLFEWHKKLGVLQLWPSWAPAANVIIYSALAILCARATFLLAEKAGDLEERLKQADADLQAQIKLTAALHDIIHNTRDSLLVDGSFAKFLGANDEQRAAYVSEIWLGQLGIIQNGMRSLTGSECNVCIKLFKKDAIAKGVDGYVTVCYGPAVSIERRQRSCILPTNQGIAQESIVTKRIAFSNDILEDDRFWPRDRKDQCALHYRTVVSAPIIVDQTVRGVLCFDWSIPNQYEEWHRHAVACFTDLVSTAFYFSDFGRKLLTEQTQLLPNEQT